MSPPERAGGGADDRAPPLRAAGEHWALFVDLDGTLCPLVARPEQVDLADPQRAMLRQLAAALDGALCVVSGRRLADLQRIFRDVPIRMIAAHGAEAPGFAPLPGDEGGDNGLRRHAAELAALAACFDGVWLEDKQHALALHYRQRPEVGAELEYRLRELTAEADRLRVMHGDHVVELLPADISKGVAVARAMRDPAFSGRRPVAIGDDVTDEDAFAAAQGLDGFGVHVGNRSDSVARYRLADVQAANDWLARLAGV